MRLDQLILRSAASALLLLVAVVVLASPGDVVDVPVDQLLLGDVAVLVRIVAGATGVLVVLSAGTVGRALDPETVGRLDRPGEGLGAVGAVGIDQQQVRQMSRAGGEQVLHGQRHDQDEDQRQHEQQGQAVQVARQQAQFLGDAGDQRAHQAAASSPSPPSSSDR